MSPSPELWLVRRRDAAKSSGMAVGGADAAEPSGTSAGAGGSTVGSSGRAAGSDEVATAMADAMEPSLLPPTTRLLRRFPTEAMQRRYLRHLQQKIRRNPRDLQAHVGRILILRLLRDGDAAAEALSELHRILGTRGVALRARLFGHIVVLLTPQQRRLLDPDAIPGALPIVVLRRAPASPASVPLELARQAIAAGRDDAAQLLLEGALDEDPGDVQVCDALLGLYRRRRARADLLKTRAALLGRRLALPEKWQAVAAELATD